MRQAERSNILLFFNTKPRSIKSARAKKIRKRGNTDLQKYGNKEIRTRKKKALKE